MNATLFPRDGVLSFILDVDGWIFLAFGTCYVFQSESTEAHQRNVSKLSVNEKKKISKKQSEETKKKNHYKV